MLLTMTIRTSASALLLWINSRPAQSRETAHGRTARAARGVTRDGRLSKIGHGAENSAGTSTGLLISTARNRTRCGKFRSYRAQRSPWSSSSERQHALDAAMIERLRLGQPLGRDEHVDDPFDGTSRSCGALAPAPADVRQESVCVSQIQTPGFRGGSSLAAMSRSHCRRRRGSMRVAAMARRASAESVSASMRMEQLYAADWPLRIASAARDDH
jgi:hypothetical protein